MELADARGGSVRLYARKSLRAFKKTPQYRALLKSVLERRESPAMSPLERRRLRLERLMASQELDLLQQGQSLSEFTGVVALPDPMAGLLEGADE